ncbi:hypothetical protein [Streptomyces niveiscabiei]|uniref:hypothetical protein n=1 Tax=Streptomyces niveiscabiei TaxID=164115 RepID=UPI0029CA5B00|nr:hypothetical protein [Streptomyces niveiscabiei]
MGAGIAMNDVDGFSNDLCVTGPRIDQVVVTSVPDERGDHYAPFVLGPAPLPRDDPMAPMGCVAGDFNEDGHSGLLVYYWGRTSIVFQAWPGLDDLTADSFAVTIADFDGDGHEDASSATTLPTALFSTLPRGAAWA